MIKIVLDCPHCKKTSVHPVNNAPRMNGAAESAIAKALASLRARGYVQGPVSAIQATRLGSDAYQIQYGTVQPIARGEALLAYWSGQFGKCAGALLRTMVDLDGKDMGDEDLEALDYSPTSGGVAKAMGRLRRVGLVDGWHASDDFLSIMD